MNVRVGTITSSPAPTPRAASARCKATVPLQHEMACLTPQNSAKAVSNFSMYLPLDEIHVDSKQSITYSFSFPTSIGAATGMNRLSISGMLHLPFRFPHPIPTEQQVIFFR